MTHKRRARSKRHHPLLARAVKLAGGSQERLAQRTGISQSAIARMLLMQQPISAELAARVEVVTNGEITRFALRPDIFFPGPSPRENPAHHPERSPAPDLEMRP